MGGNLMKVWNLPMRRVGCTEYDAIANGILHHLHDFGKMHDGFRYEIVRHVREKQDFGDIDILCSNQYNESLLGYLEEISEHQPHINAGVFSIPYINFQIDLITLPLDRIDFACYYFGCNDIGNILGRIVKSVWHVKFGRDGLYYVIREDDITGVPAENANVMCEHLLTTDFKIALDLVELDFEPVKQGFKTYEDMFRYASSCKYFNPSFFKLENLNHINRTRDRKRKTYNMFLDWISMHNDLCQHYDGHSREHSLKILFERFPDLESAFYRESVNLEYGRLRHFKFNGDLAMVWHRFDNPESLGKAMVKFKSYITGIYGDFDAWLLRTNMWAIQCEFKKFADSLPSWHGTCCDR